MKNTICLVLIALLFNQCRQESNTGNEYKAYIMENTVNQIIDSLVLKHGDAQRDRIARGVRQTASFWKETDGTGEEFAAYCTEHFISDTAVLDGVFQRISTNFEVIFGYYAKISVDLQRPLHLDIGEILPVDESFGSYSPATHFTDDFFNNKLAFLITLNFPYYSLPEKTEKSAQWSRKDWAYARLGDVFDSRVPADVSQLVVNAMTKSDMYIADYNIFAGKLVRDQRESLFPPDMKLLSHWNIRDEIKSNYGQEAGIKKQRILYEVMKRIITQEIPEVVINSKDYIWDPFNNKVYENGTAITATPEPDTRYAMILDFFRAQRQVDPYYPGLNTYILRNFNGDMEIPLEDVEELFKTYLSSPEVQKVAEVIKKRLGRNLEPFDIWYDGFKTRTTIPAETLDKATRSKYPDRDAVQADLPRILVNLGFSKDRAETIASQIQVDPARGSGHAQGSETREQKSLLRTRIFADGMDYKGYNIAVHEFGHNVEQTISLHNMDFYMLRGVPNTAFTEAAAFMFQKNDLKLLGMDETDRKQVYLDYLDNFWQLYEIMGVSLVDIGTWKWLYANPDATPEALKEAVNTIATEIWNSYYAPVFGVKDQPVLAIYSHMINVPLYLPNYAYGHIIEFQLAEFLEGKDFAGEFERIYRLGRLIPQQWMLEATGSKISVQPILNSVNEALLNM
ncbi:MAG TPA: hypothetical protein VJ203_05755 [Bacteroidales bacterium]|nr:hypothetical protein [Bacteroidales bacterium]